MASRRQGGRRPKPPRVPGRLPAATLLSLSTPSSAIRSIRTHAQIAHTVAASVQRTFTFGNSRRQGGCSSREVAGAAAGRRGRRVRAAAAAAAGARSVSRASAAVADYYHTSRHPLITSTNTDEHPRHTGRGAGGAGAAVAILRGPPSSAPSVPPV